ncbi:hypothetical protein HY496_01040 [Candidatus Woesearchaeota archaeon]|nr:hypothetical protein [Candidatus Woesearchaeota archaeon]
MTLLVRVPLRVSFCGGGTDVKDFYLAHGGATLLCNIARYVYVSLTPRADDQVVIQDIDFGTSTVFQYDQEPSFDGLSDLAKACVKFVKLQSGVTIGIKSDVAPGCGLGTSSAIAVGLIYGLNHLFGLGLPTRSAELAHQAFVVEREILGWEGGMQDFVAAAYASNVHLVEYSSKPFVVHALNYRKSFLHDLQMHTLLCYTGMTHQSSLLMSSVANQNNIPLLQKLTALTYQLEQAWNTEDIELFARYIDESYQLKKQLHDQITNATIESLYQEGKSAGAWGGKLLGAGAGGYLLFFVPFERQQVVKEKLRSLNGQVEPFLFDREGLQSWESVKP